MTLVTLLAGSDAGAREAAIAERVKTFLDSGTTSAIILEGMPANAVHFDSSIQLVRLAPGCPCCTGNLAMRVTLNRILRRPPERLYISIADATHLKSIRTFLTQAPYDALIAMDDDLLI